MSKIRRERLRSGSAAAGTNLECHVRKVYFGSRLKNCREVRTVIRNVTKATNGWDVGGRRIIETYQGNDLLQIQSLIKSPLIIITISSSCLDLTRVQTSEREISRIEVGFFTLMVEASEPPRGLLSRGLGPFLVLQDERLGSCQRPCVGDCIGRGPSRLGFVAVVPTDSEVVIRRVSRSIQVIVLAER